MTGCSESSVASSGIELAGWFYLEERDGRVQPTLAMSTDGDMERVSSVTIDDTALEGHPARYALRTGLTEQISRGVERAGRAVVAMDFGRDRFTLFFGEGRPRYAN